MKKTLLLCLLLAAVVCGCKKYEDGPLISFRSAKSRLLGHHTLTKFTINGVDSLQAMNDRYGVKYYFYYNNSLEHYTLMIENDKWQSYHEFKFMDKNTGIEIRQSVLCPSCNGEAELYYIKLMHNDIHLKSTFNSTEYYLELE